MPSRFDQNHIIHLADPRLNKVDLVYPGESTVGDVGLTNFRGQIGARMVFGKDEVKFDSTVGTLYGGIYQLVKTKAASTIAPARGLICFWDPASPHDFIVTPDAPTGSADFAGVYLSAPTKGQYCVIQVAGIASVMGVASALTKATGAVGDLLFAAALATVDNIADATALTAVEVRKIVGIAIEAPVAATIKLVRLTMPRWSI
jgi:hypothetical protein